MRETMNRRTLLGMMAGLAATGGPFAEDAASNPPEPAPAHVPRDKDGAGACGATVRVLAA